MLWIRTRDAIVIYANGAACEVLQIGADGLIGRPLSAIDTSASADAIRAVAGAQQSGKPMAFQTRFLRRDGATRDVDVTAAFSCRGGEDVGSSTSPTSPSTTKPGVKYSGPRNRPSRPRA